jgi:hypothetical protein
MRVLKGVLVLFALILFTGCAASGPLYKDVSASIPPLAAGKGRIYFFRADTMLGAAVTSDISLNDKVVGKSERGSFFFVDQAPGNCKVRTSTEVERQLTFALAAGETKYVQTSVSMGAFVGHISPELVSPDKGRTELAELHYTGTALPASVKK